MRAVHAMVGELPGSDPLGSAAGLRGAVLVPAGTGARALAAVVDLGVLVLLLMVPVLLSVVGSVVSGAAPAVALLACAVASVAVLVGVAVVWPAVDGARTPGMRSAGLRVVDRHGRAATGAALAVRALLVPLDLLVGVPLVLLREDRRRLGDLLAGTQVVRDAVVVPRPLSRPGPGARSRPARRPS